MKQRDHRLFLYQKVDGYWYWRIVASNGRTAAQCGLGFTRCANALKAVRSLLRQHCPVPLFQEPPDPPLSYLMSGRRRTGGLGAALLLVKSS